MFRIARFLCLLGLVGLPAWGRSADSAADLGRRWKVYAQGLASQGRQGEAGPAFDKALQFLPGDAQVLRARGQWHWAQGQRDLAFQDLRASLAADPSQSALQAWLATATGGAPATISTPAAVTADTDDADALENAQALLESRDFAGALAAEAASTQQPRSADWLRLRSEAYYGLGRFDEAQRALAQARALSPQDAALQRLDQQYYHPGLASDQGGGPILPPLWRSALLPGWGQAYNGQTRKAWIMGVLTVGLLAATAYTYVATDQAIADYHALDAQATASDFDSTFGRADGMATLNQALGISFYTAYAYNLFDAGANARPGSPAKIQAGLRLPVLALNF